MPTKVKQYRAQLEEKMREFFTDDYAEWLADTKTKPSDEAIRAYSEDVAGAGGLTAQQIYGIVKF